MLQLRSNFTSDIYLNFGDVVPAALVLTLTNCLSKATTSITPTFVSATIRARRYSVVVPVMIEGQYIVQYMDGVNEIWRGMAFVRNATPYNTNAIIEYNDLESDYIYT